MEHPLQALIDLLHRAVRQPLLKWFLVLFVFAFGLAGAIGEWIVHFGL